MRDNEIKKFYPALMLLVTGFSFLLFTLLLSIVNGVNTRPFLLIGLGCFILGLLAGVIALRNLAAQKKRKEKRIQELREQGFA